MPPKPRDPHVPKYRGPPKNKGTAGFPFGFLLKNGALKKWPQGVQQLAEKHSDLGSASSPSGAAPSGFGSSSFGASA